MSGSTLITYSLPRQDVSRLATWSVTSGTPDPGYPASNFTGVDPTSPGKLLSTSGIFLASFGSAQTITGVALIHTNLKSTVTVHLQGSTSSGFGTLAADVVIPMPAARNNWPINPVVRFAGVTATFWRINISTANAVPVSIGHIALLIGTELVLVGAQQGVQWMDTIPCWNDETELSVPMNLDLLTQTRAVQINTIQFNAQQDALDDWWFDARGLQLPFLVRPDVSSSECYWMTFAEKAKVVMFQVESPYGRVRTMQVKLQEWGRGMLPTPWSTG